MKGGSYSCIFDGALKLLADAIRQGNSANVLTSAILAGILDL